MILWNKRVITCQIKYLSIDYRDVQPLTENNRNKIISTHFVFFEEVCVVDKKHSNCS